jgi:hypothetical protein
LVGGLNSQISISKYAAQPLPDLCRIKELRLVLKNQLEV